MKKANYYKNAISAFITSEKGQRFFNFAYSIGAAIVIWGALFKILHLRGGNTLLCIGMGTEVLMFILTAFDRPPKDYKWEKAFPQLGDGDDDESAESPIIVGGSEPAGSGVVANPGVAAYPAGAYPAQAPHAYSPASQAVQAAADAVAARPEGEHPTDAGGVTEEYIDRMSSITSELEKLQASTTALNRVSETLLKSFEAITQHSEDIDHSANGYVEQMQNLNHNIQGLNTIYEIQLKSISSQLDAIDRVNRGIKDIRDMYEKSASQSVRYCEETEKMARYMQQLNQVYEKMLTAMTINMYRPMPGVPASESNEQ